MINTELFDAFNRIALFKGVSEEDFGTITRKMLILRRKKGQYFFLQGDKLECVFIVLQGVAKVVRMTETGKSLTLYLLTMYQTWGAGSMFNELPLSVSLQALQDTKVALLAKRDFLSLVSKYPSIMANTIVELRDHYRGTARMVSIIATCEAESRIAKTILWCHSILGDNLCLTHQDVADMIGTSRETVSRTMANLRREGVVTPTNFGFEILDKMKLDLLAK